MTSLPARITARRSLGLAAILAVTAGGLAACGSSKPSSSTSSLGSATSGSIVWSASPISGTGATDTRTVLINAFEKAYPHIHVTLTSAPSNTDTNRSTLATEISGGSSTPDVYMGDVIWPAQFGEHGFAVPLSKYLPASYWAKFYPGLVKGATYNGQVYGSPLFQDMGFLYYRKDLLAKAHMSPPTTWEQLETEASTLVKDKLVKYGFVWEGDSYEGLTCNFMEYLADAGGSVTNSSYSKSTIDSAAGVKAVTFMKSLITSGASPAAVATFQEPQAIGVFTAGDAAFMRNWDYGYDYSITPATSKLTKAQVGVEALPTFSGMSYPGYANIGGWNMYINPHSKHLGVDLTFIKWLSSTTAQDILALKYGEISTVTSVRTASNVVASTPTFAVAAKAKLIPRPAGTPNYPQVSTAIYTNVNAVLAGSSSPSAALSAANSAIQTAVTSKAAGL
jgi:multiple sugar transport system substrate-binding protein